MKATGRFDGHIVQGHIDSKGFIVDKNFIGENVIFNIKIEKKWMKYCIPKGSIAIDGISLTIADINDNYNDEFGLITLSIIPYTLKNTNLFFKDKNNSVNVETDFFGKYIEKLLPVKEHNG